MVNLLLYLRAMKRPLLFAFAVGATGLGAWLYFRFRTPAGTVSISEVRSDDIAGDITFTQPDIQLDMPKLADIETSSPLEYVAVTARKIAATVSSWFHSRGEKYKPLFDAAEKKYGIPPGLLFRQAYQESRFRDDIITGVVRSAAGAVGILQIIPKYHPSLGEAGALNVPKAVDYGASYLAQLKKQFGSWELALAAYNWGPTNVKNHPDARGWPKETRDYVSEITSDVNVRVA